jgi:hypothetical protein
MKRLLVGGTGGGQLIKSTPREGQGGSLGDSGPGCPPKKRECIKRGKEAWGGLSVRVSPAWTAGGDAARKGL